MYEHASFRTILSPIRNSKLILSPIRNSKASKQNGYKALIDIGSDTTMTMFGGHLAACEQKHSSNSPPGESTLELHNFVALTLRNASGTSMANKIKHSMYLTLLSGVFSENVWHTMLPFLPDLCFTPDQVQSNTFFMQFVMCYIRGQLLFDANNIQKCRSIVEYDNNTQLKLASKIARKYIYGREDRVVRRDEMVPRLSDLRYAATTLCEKARLFEILLLVEHTEEAKDLLDAVTQMEETRSSFYAKTVGNTELFFLLVSVGRVKSVRFLVEQGANTGACNKAGNTVIEYVFVTEKERAAAGIPHGEHRNNIVTIVTELSRASQDERSPT